MGKDKKFKWNKVYMIGIKGVGMTMLAQLLAERGSQVSGSDVPDTFMTDQVLRRAGIKVFSGFDARHIPATADAIIYSSAYLPATNVELAAALASSIPTFNYAEALGQTFSSFRQGVAVCGSHGKTTVSAWLGYVLDRASLSPSVLVGARVPQLGGSSLAGNSDIIVAEADEYQDKLRFLSPRGVVLTNIDYDHPDYYKTKRSYYEAFARFVARLPKGGWLVVDGDDRLSLKAASSSQAALFSCSLQLKKEAVARFSDNQLVAYGYRRQGSRQYFQVNSWGEFSISLLGVHNVKNALLVIAASRKLGVNVEDIRRHLAAFKGTARRSQLIGEYSGALIYDDYGHHPTEIKATIKAFREYFPDRKLRVLFHPHTFSRTKALFGDFSKSFANCDDLGILEIYGSAREKSGGVGSRDLLAAIRGENKDNNRKQTLRYFSDLSKAAQYYWENLKAGEVLLLLGAGDVFRVGEEILGNKRKKI